MMYLRIMVLYIAWHQKSHVIKAQWLFKMWPLLAPGFVSSHSALHLFYFSQTAFFLFSNVPQPYLPECPCPCRSPAWMLFACLTPWLLPSHSWGSAYPASPRKVFPGHPVYNSVPQANPYHIALDPRQCLHSHRHSQHISLRSI